MVRSILKPQSPSSSQPHSPQHSVPFSKRRHPPRLSYAPPRDLPLTSSPPSPHVHFPPTPAIVSSTYITHSPSIYDRAPIEVIPNSCALPDRGDRVLDNSLPITTKTQRDRKGGYFHPSAYEVCEPEYDNVPSAMSVPQLIRDCSSSSESDEPAEGYGYGSPYPSPTPVEMNPISPIAMSFLPHPGHPPKKKPDGTGIIKLKRRKTVPMASREEPPSLDGCLGGF